MIIDLDTSVHQRWADVHAEPRFRDAMTNLALAFYEGKHLVCGPRRLLEALARSDALDANTRGLFRELIQERQHILKLRRERVSCFIRVHARAPQQLTTVEGQARCFHVPYSYFDDSARVQAVALVAEDQDDAILYMHAARAYLAYQASASKLRVRCKPVAGGGSSTADCVRSEAAERPVLCITDSDRKWPGARIGHTARYVADEVERLQENLRRVADCYVLPCHELENLLPFALLDDALPPAVDRRPYRRAHALGVLAAADDKRFLDLKEGLRYRDVLHDEPAARRRYLRRVTRRIVGDEPRQWCDSECERNTRHGCECIVFEALRDDLVKHAASFAGERTPHELMRYLLSSRCPNRESWERIGRLVASWACAMKRRRV